MGDQNLIDKSMRSVFVGNIPYEATEEKLKDIFSEVGPVLSFKLVFDRETGKPKGYGFCEYKDTETALSAMRNLNGYEIGGRTLRVDNACTEKSRLEMQTLLQSTPVESPYGEPINSDKAPDAICKTIASMPPEQMFELMKQMKDCIQNNPNEARTMLLQNPQLSYAILQGLVIMRVVDPSVAVTMLHKANPTPVPLYPSDKPMTVPLSTPASAPSVGTANPAPPAAPQPVILPTENWAGTLPPSAPLPTAAPRPATTSGFMGIQDMDMRQSVDPRMGRISDQDLRIPPSAQGVPGMPVHPALGRDSFPADPYSTSRDPRDPRMSVGGDRFPSRDPRDPRDPRDIRDIRDPREIRDPRDMRDPRDPRDSRDPRDPRDRDPRDPRDRVDPRTGVNPLPPNVRPPVLGGPPLPVPRPVAPPLLGPGPLLGAPGASDQEKAALIMQVLQLSDEQIAILPPDQRQSILLLKEQIAKSAQR
ncbi:Cleavage stimulation factor subunit 2 [Frankliniella fusca]|uniref:Cleavage stimulation factor subunit 2 n=1 Tax=Frankliniella fusca TaxID=407009 RepID=A0AAE1HTA2_9NEOP|nr:Cleavage stimulation factor subunit 2 [Frankliniella fusca]